MKGGLSHSEFSRKGGSARSEAKLRAAMANLERAGEVTAEKNKALAPTICAGSPPAKRLA